MKKKIAFLVSFVLVLCMSLAMALANISFASPASAEEITSLAGTNLNGAVILDKSNRNINSNSYIIENDTGYVKETGRNSYLFQKNGRSVPFVNFFVDTLGEGGSVLKGRDNYNGFPSYGYISGTGEPVYKINKETGEREKDNDGNDIIEGYNSVVLKVQYNFDKTTDLLGSDGQYYTISEDTWKKTINNIPSVGVVGKGAVIVQKFVPTDGKAYPQTADDWKRLNQFSQKETDGIHTVNFFQEYDPATHQTAFTIYQPKGEDLQKGVFIKLSVAYEVKHTEVTYKNGWFGKKKVETIKYTNILEETVLYLSNASGEVVFENFYFESSSGEDEQPESSVSTKTEQKGGPISDNQGSIDGFRLDTRGNNFDISYRYNNSSNEMKCEDGQFFKNPGKYDFKIKTKVGLERTKTVYIHEKTNDENVQVYFGDGLIDKASQRVFNPNSTYPVYVAGKTKIQTQNENRTLVKHAPLVGRVYNFSDEYENIERDEKGIAKIGFVCEKTADNKSWSFSDFEVGNYEVVFANNEEYFKGTATGDTYVFVWRFSIVQSGETPTVNGELLNEHVGVSDYDSMFYSADIETKGKGKILVAFADETSAYDFACRYFVSKVQKNGNEYVFENVTYQKESKVLEALRAKAKSIVSKRFFDLTNVASFVTIKENILLPELGENPTEDERKEYESFVSLTKKELSQDVIVFNSEDSSLLSGTPFLNDRKIAYLDENGDVKVETKPLYFVSLADFESQKITLKHIETNKTFVVPFGTGVEAFLEANNAPTGKYKVIEENYAGTSEYDAIYIKKGDIQTTISLERALNGETTVNTLSKLDDSLRVRANVVIIKEISNQLDPYGFVKIIKNGTTQNVYHISEADSIPVINEEGNYEIVLVDRLGNQVKFYVDIYNATKVYSLSLKNGDKEIFTDIAYGGKAFALPTLTPASDKFEFAGFADKNGKIYKDIYVFNTPEDVALTAVWNYVSVSVEIYDGNKITSYTKKVGDVQALPKLTKEGYTLYGFKFVLPDGTIKFYRGQIKSVANQEIMRLDAVWVKNQEVSDFESGTDDTVIISLVNGTIESKIVANKTEKISLPTIESENLVFAGWLYEYKLSGMIFTTEMTMDEILAIGTDNENSVVLRAIWQSKEKEQNNNSLAFAGLLGTGKFWTNLWLEIKENVALFVSMFSFLIVCAVVFAFRKRIIAFFLKAQEKQQLAFAGASCTSDGEESAQTAQLQEKPKKHAKAKRTINVKKFFKKALIPCMFVVMSLLMLFTSTGQFMVAVKEHVDENRVVAEMQIKAEKEKEEQEKQKEEEKKLQETYNMVERSFESQGEEDSKEKSFLYSLAILDLYAIGFDDVFPAFAKTSENKVIKGYAYTNYAEAFEENGKILFKAGFITLMENGAISAEDVENGVIIERDTEYGENEYNTFKLAYNQAWGVLHYVAFEKYTKYQVNNYSLQYEITDDTGEYDDLLGDVYNYDIGDYCHYNSYGEEFKFDAYTLDQSVDYAQIVEMLKESITNQDVSSLDINVEKADFISYQAMKDYMTHNQDETMLGVDADTLLYYEAHIGTTNYYVIKEDGTVEVLQIPPDPVKQASIWERIWVGIASIGVAIVGVVCTVLAPGIGTIFGGAMISAALDVFMQVTVSGTAPENINWGSVIKNGVVGAVTGFFSLGTGALVTNYVSKIGTFVTRSLAKIGVAVLNGLFSSSVSLLADYIATGEKLSFEDCMKSIGISIVTSVILMGADSFTKKVTGNIAWKEIVSQYVMNSIAGAGLYALSCAITGNPPTWEGFLTSFGMSVLTTTVTVIGSHIGMKIKTAKYQRALRQQELLESQEVADFDNLDPDDIKTDEPGKQYDPTLETFPDDSVDPEILKKRVKYLPGPKNDKWEIYSTDGTTKITKQELIANNGNGIIKGKNGVMIPVKNGCPDFSHYSHATLNFENLFSTDRELNFNDFDSTLAEDWSGGNIPKKYQQWFDDRPFIDKEFLTKQDIKLFRTSNSMVWHECENGRTAQLLDRSLHNVRNGGIPHLGGISELKYKQQAASNYDLVNKRK